MAPDFVNRSENNFIKNIKQLYLLMNHHIDDELQAYGLARSQFQVLYFVYRGGRLTQKELQEIMQVKAATLTGIIDSLTRKGLIERTENKQDKRSNILCLTQKGRRLGEKIPALHSVIEQRLFNNFSAVEKKMMVRLTGQMIDNLTEKRV